MAGIEGLVSSGRRIFDANGGSFAIELVLSTYDGPIAVRDVGIGARCVWTAGETVDQILLVVGRRANAIADTGFETAVDLMIEVAVVEISVKGPAAFDAQHLVALGIDHEDKKGQNCRKNKCGHLHGRVIGDDKSVMAA